MKRKRENQCFFCLEDGRDSIHVVRQSDGLVKLLEGKGLINFGLKSIFNKVRLCPNCHKKYNDHADPRAIFYPVDLEYFIRFELRDRARRQKNGLGRKVPTQAQYARRCGFYTRLLFKLKGPGENQVIQEDPVEWCGAPLAALRRAFGMMGSPRAAAFPPGDMASLRTLWDLYFQDDNKIADELVTRYRAGADDTGFGLEEEDSSSDEAQEEKEEGPVRKKRAVTPSNSSANFNFRKWCWEFGPDSSSKDKAEGLARSS